ncbi:MAG TPA: isoprenylcysteine carboxylmethyltransferase family protein [Spirochaetia bacterium]|nr:isoprenylcysteine carboxylmethyltransferase family protein [Spirochaetia bacterium]
MSSFYGVNVIRDLYLVSSGLWLAFWVLWLVWGMITTRQRRVVKGQRGGTLPVWAIVLAVILFRRYFLTHFLGSALWPGNLTTVIAGLLLELLGLAVAVWARYYLGSFWSGSVVLREGHKVVDTGPYRLVRHPIYSGILLALVGSFLMEGATFWLVALTAGALGMWWKAWSEERLLTTELGEEYVSYRQRTRMLIPWLL